MASQEIGSLFVALGLDSAVFTAGVKQVQSATGKLQKGLEGIAARAESMGKKLSVVSAAVAAFGLAAAGIVKSTATAAGEIAKQSQIANASADEFQRWAAGSKTVGIEQEKLSDILKDVNDRVGDFNATGGGPMADFFENIAPKVGITADAFKDLSGPQALQLYVSSLEKAGLSQQEMTFYMEAMASDSTALLPLLLGNGVAMTRLGDAATATGAVMSDKLIAGSKVFNEKLTGLMGAVEGVRNRLAEALLPVVNQLIDAFMIYGVPAMNAMAMGLESLIEWFGSLSEPVQMAAGIIAAALGVGGPVLLAVAAMSSAFAAIVAATGPIGLFIAAAAAITAAWATWGEDIKLAVGGAIDWVTGKFDALMGKINAMIETLKGWGTAVRDALTFGEGEVDGLGASSDGFDSFMDGGGGGGSQSTGRNTAAGITSGFVDGMAAGRGAVEDAIQSGLIDTAERKLGIQSPSRVFMGIGDFIAQGLGLGLQQGTPQVQAAMEGVTDAITDNGGLTDSLQTFADTAKTIFSRVAFEGEKLGDVLKSIAASWLGNAANSLMGSAFDQLFGIGANANGTNNWRGGLTRVNERGGEIMNLPSGTQIIPHDVSKRMADRSGGGDVVVRVVMDESTGKLAGFVDQRAGALFQAGIQQYDSQVLPGSIRRARQDPRFVGG